MESANTTQEPLESRPAALRYDYLHVRILSLVLATIPVPALRSSDFYLTHLGPPPLRFAAVPTNPNSFTWPVALNLAPTPVRTETNSTTIPSIPSSVSSTNTASSLPSAGTTEIQTNTVSRPQVTETIASPAPSTLPAPLGSDGRPLAASNLLIVTPQMLADYFRANLDGSDRTSTNAISGADVPFNPPTPKVVPSSEAIYRIQ